MCHNFLSKWLWKMNASASNSTLAAYGNPIMAPTMAPSRVHVGAPSDEMAVNQQSQSALVAAKRNFNYLINPSTATQHPSRFRTRALLRSVRYLATFIFWRVIRYAKFVAVGAVAAAVGATALGSVVTGVAWIAAPTSITAAIVSASIWGVGKWGAKRLHSRWERTGRDHGVELREHTEANPVKAEGTWRKETGPAAIPW
jgi:hypothetical protein